MKFFYLLLFFFLSCSAMKIEPIPKNDHSKFMKHEKIKQEFAKLNNHDLQMIEVLDQDALNRLANIQEIVTPKELEKIKSIKKIKFTKNEIASGFIDNRKCDTPVVSQCGGSCTSHAITNTIDNLLCLPKKQNSSNEDLWNNYRVYYTSAGIKAAKDFEICENKDWSNCKKRKASCNDNRHIKLLETKEIGNNIEVAKSLLDKGFPIIYSGKVTRSWVNCDPVVNPYSSALSGGHAVSIVGYKDDSEIVSGGYFIIKNSWGKSCGDNGYQYLPYHYCNREDGGMYCFMDAVTKIESKYLDSPNVKPKKKCKWFRKCHRSWKTWFRWKCWKYKKCD